MTWNHRVLAGSLLALAFAARAQAQEAELGRGLQLLDRAEPAAAEPQLARATATALLALAESQTGEARKATLARAADFAPSDATALRQRIQALQKMAEGHAAEAAELLARLATADPGDKRVAFDLGMARRAADDRPGAIAALRSAVALDPNYAAALLPLGDALRESGDFGAAYNAYNHALGADGRPVAALLGRAASRMLLGDEEGAGPDLVRAVELSAPGMERYRALMGGFYIAAYERQLAVGVGRVEEAISMWQQLGRSDMAAAACNAAGRIYLETGDPESADRWYQRGWELVSASKIPAAERTLWQVRMLHGTARVAAARRELSRADELVAQARGLMDSDSANAEHYRWIYPYLKAYVELARRDPDAAIANLQEVPESEMSRPYLQYLMAEAYARKRDRDTARIWYRKALDSAIGLDVETAIVRPLATAWLAKNPARN